jgi:hypothetical protein
MIHEGGHRVENAAILAGQKEARFNGFDKELDDDENRLCAFPLAQPRKEGANVPLGL